MVQRRSLERSAGGEAFLSPLRYASVAARSEREVGLAAMGPAFQAQRRGTSTIQV